MSHKILDNNIVAIRKSKLALKLNKPAYIGMCIVEFSKVSMCEFHDGHIKNKYGNKSKQRVTVYCMKLKLKMYMNYLAAIKKCLISVIIQLSQNTMMIQTN